MPDAFPLDLTFAVTDVRPVEQAVAPAIAFAVRVGTMPGGVAVASIALDVQVRIDAPARPHAAPEVPRLRELFGPPSDWGRTMRSLLWANARATVPAFTGEGRADVIVPCPFEWNVAAARYVFALDEDGPDVPVTLHFGGLALLAGDDGVPRVSPIPRSKEARAVLPVRTWHALLERFFPGTRVLALRRDAFARLDRFRARESLATFEEALDRLLPAETACPDEDAPAGDAPAVSPGKRFAV